MAVVRYELVGDNSDLKAALQDTQQEFRETGRAADAAAKKVDRVGNAGSKAAGDASKLKSGLEGAKNAAAAMGGAAGDMAGRLENAAKAFGGVGAALGPVGVGVGALVATVGALAVGMGVLAAKSVEAQDRLIAAGKGALIPPEARASADAYREATERLSTSVDEFLVVLGSGLLPALTSTVQTVSSVVESVTGLHDGWVKLAGVMGTAADVVSLGTLPVLRFGRDTVNSFAQAARDAASDTEAWRRRLQDMGVSTKFGAGAWVLYASELAKVKPAADEAKQGLSDLAIDMALAEAEAEDAARKASAARGDAQIAKAKEERARKAAEASKAASEAAKLERDQAVAGIEAQLDATEALEKATQDAFRSTLEGEAAIRVAHADRLRAIEELAAASQDAGAAEAARAAEEVRFRKELAALEARQAQDRAKAGDDAWKADLQRAKDRLDAHTAEAEAAAAANQQILDSGMTAYNSISDAVSALLQQKIDAARDGSAAEKNAALAAFATQKALGLVQIAINTAVAITTALKQLGPVAGGVAAAGITATGVAQAAIVAGQKPPSFAGGGIVDEVLRTPGTAADHGVVSARPGEGMLTKRGVDTAGGEAGVQALNQGRQPWGGGGPLVVQHVYRHRVFDSFITENLRRGGPLSRAIASARKSGHSRRA